MGGDSHSEDRGFKSGYRILDGHFSTYICCKNCNDVCLNRPKINEKDAGVGPFFKKTNTFLLLFPYGRKVFHCLNGHLPLMVVALMIFDHNL